MYSNNHCLVFSHNENSSGYQGCDTKYGDISQLNINYPYEGESGPMVGRPWAGVMSSATSIVIENKIKPNDMSYWFMFAKCNIENISNIDTSQCIEMDNIFVSSKISGHLDLSSWNTENVTTMAQMFSGSNQLTSLDISSFDTNNVTSMYQMFNGCSNLSNISYGSKFVKNSGCNIENMFASEYGSCPANRPSWYTE